MNSRFLKACELHISFSFFLCKAHILCMNLLHTGAPKHEHLPIMPTRRADWSRFTSSNLTQNNSCLAGGAQPFTACGILSVCFDTFHGVGRNYVFEIICLRGMSPRKGALFLCFHYRVRGTKRQRNQ